MIIGSAPEPQEVVVGTLGCCRDHPTLSARSTYCPLRRSQEVLCRFGARTPEDKKMNPCEGPGGGPLAEPQGRQKMKFSPKNEPPGIFLKVTWVVNFGTVSTVAAFIWRGSSYVTRKMRFEFRPNMGSLFYPPARSGTEVPPTWAARGGDSVSDHFQQKTS
jgi:hypothetical protein